MSDPRVPKELVRPPVRMLGGWVLVWLLPKEDRCGSLVLPESTYLKADDLAVVVDAPEEIPMKKGFLKASAKAGDVVVLIRLLEKGKVAQWVENRLGEGFIIVRWNDLIGVVEGEGPVRILDAACS